MHTGAVQSEGHGDGPADAAGSARDDGALAVKAEIRRIVIVVFQSDTPLFQGMKSSCASNSALVRISPLDTCRTKSRIASADSSSVGDPEITPPASKSIMSDMRRARSEFVEILTTGGIGLPVGVPNPVVNRTTLVPAPACAVTHSTSFPGVH